MLKIFLVEDESIMREGLRDNMPWQQFGYQFVGEAADGETALPLIRKTRPDVLLTDIKMPFMDGLSLSRIVAKEFPNMKIIILSGYDDFEYARQAIQIGVEQYILKPVTRETLKKVLLEVKAKIDSEKEEKINLEKIQSERREYELMSRRTFFEKVFSGRLLVQEIYTEMEKFSIDLEGPCFNLIMVSVQRKSKTAARQTADSQKFIRCQDEMMHYFLRFPEYIIFNWNMNTCGILIKGEADMMEMHTRKALQNINRIYSQIEDEYDWYAAKASPVERLSLLSECYEEVNHQLSLQYLAWRNSEEQVVLEDGGNIPGENSLPDEEYGDDKTKAMLKKVLEYIEEKYTDESLSLNDAAGVANVSPNYFSAIFSQEMNMTFIEYVTKKRMDKAKKLLRQSRMSTADVAVEVGYKDSHYFSFVFKKTQGCTPREYRNDSKNG